jgi:hypothetical protein
VKSELIHSPLFMWTVKSSLLFTRSD